MTKHIYIGFFILLAVILKESFSLHELIQTKINLTETHYLLPKSANCAVKMMYFQDATGDVRPAVRTVCHWENK